MEINIVKLINLVRKNIKEKKILLTGLNEQEKDFINILYGNDLINNEGKKDILIYGSLNVDNKKIEDAKKLKIKCYSLQEFKENFLYNHNAKNKFENLNILIDINIEYKKIMPIYLLNPKSVIWSNQINKKKVEEINIIISNEENLDNIRPGLKNWIKDKKILKLNFEGENIFTKEKDIKKIKNFL